LKRVPKRLCIGCGERKDQADLLRIVRTENGLRLDTGRRSDGRGAWICKDPACADRMVKRKALDRTFRSHFADDTYCRIREEMRELYG